MAVPRLHDEVTGFPRPRHGDVYDDARLLARYEDAVEKVIAAVVDDADAGHAADHATVHPQDVRPVVGERHMDLQPEGPRLDRRHHRDGKEPLSDMAGVAAEVHVVALDFEGLLYPVFLHIEVS